MLVPPSNFGMVEEDLYRSGAPDLINLPFLNKLQLKSLLWLAPEEPDRELQKFCATHDISLYHLGSLPRLAAIGAGGNASSHGSGGTGSAASAAAAAAAKALPTSFNTYHNEDRYDSSSSRNDDLNNNPSLKNRRNDTNGTNDNLEKPSSASASNNINRNLSISNTNTSAMSGSSTIMGGGGAWEPITEDLVLSALQLLVNPQTYPAMVMCNQGRHRTGTVIGCLRKLQRWCLSSILEEYRRFAGPKVRVMNEQFIELFDIDLVFE